MSKFADDTEVDMAMPKKCVTFASNFCFRSQAPQILTQNLSENHHIFSEKQSYRLLSPDVRLDLRYLAITLSGNLKIYSKSEKKPM